MKNSIIRSVFLLMGAVMLLLPSAGYSADVIKTGVTQPLSGSVAASGNYVTKGAMIAESFVLPGWFF
jgi:branched-chain amino acid transport system substrate-binding protein